MRCLKAVLLGLLPAIALVPTLARAAPGDGLANSAHDFSGQGTPPTSLCVFCHTPHKAQIQGLLWNHTLSANTFSWTDTVTTAGTSYPSFAGDTYKGSTAKCLSCHDGSLTVGDIGWWNGGDPLSLDNTQLNAGALNIADPNTGNMDGNHPVAMPYPYQQVASTYNGSTSGAGLIATEFVADPQPSGIRLYNDDGAGNISGGAVSGQTGIECQSCHDVHNGPQVADVWLLRGDLGGNAATQICVKCHIK